jgi:hypothetical protein
MRRRHVDCCDQEQPFAVCKSLRVEDALTAGRESIPVNRKPLRCAGIDLMHAGIALAYSDYFLLRDGFVSNCAPYALRRRRSSNWRGCNNPPTLRKDVV